MTSPADQAFARIAGEDAERNAVVLHRVTLADVQTESVEWLWRGYVPFGKLTVLEGDPGLSKSTLALDLAARLSSGNAFPDGLRHAKADSLFASFEDGIADTIRPRAEAAGADLRRIHVLRGVTCNGDPERPLTFPDDLPVIAEELRALGARLLVVDPLSAALSGAVDAYKDHDIRRALSPLARLAEDSGAVILAVRHLTKGARASAIMAGAGSVGIAGAARVVLAVHRHPDDDMNGDRRVLAVAKCNLARIAPSQGYRLTSVGECARISWEGDSPHSADDLTAARGDDGERTAFDEAKEFLRRAFPSGQRPKADVIRDAHREGITVRTVERAKKALGITSQRGFGTAAMWSLAVPGVPSSPLPPNPANPAHVGEHGEVGRFGEDADSFPQELDAGSGVLSDIDGTQHASPERIAELRRRLGRPAA